MLHARVGGATVDITLYNAMSEIFNASNYLGVREGGSTKYAGLTSNADSGASAGIGMRVSGVTNYLMKYSVALCGVVFEEGSTNKVYLYFVNDNGTVITSATNVFTNSSFTYGVIERLSDSNYAIIYKVGNDGYFRIYDTAASLIAGPTRFESADVYPFEAHRAAALSDGKFAVVYSADVGGYNGYFIIYDNDGTESVSRTQFDSGAGYLDADGRGTLWVVAYVKSGTVYYTIRDSDGVQQLAPTSVGTGTTNVYVTFLSNGNVAVCYRDGGRAKGYFKVMDQSGNAVVSETEIGSTYDVCIDALDGRFAVIYQASSDSAGYLNVYENDGTEIATDVSFHSGATGNPTVTCSLGSGIFTVYYDDADGDKPKAVIFDRDGTEEVAEFTISSVDTGMSQGSASA